MIFATVGTQLPYDRLIRALDEWAMLNPAVDVFAQTGVTEYKPKHMRWARLVSKDSFLDHLQAADTVVAHAGMGTIITGVEYGKRTIVMPRRAEFGEHRNDHQLGTARRMSHLHGLQVVQDAEELADALDLTNSAAADSIEDSMLELRASSELISRIRSYAGLASL